MVPFHAIKSPLTPKPVIDQGPRALAAVADFTFPVVRPATGTVEEALVASCHRTYSCCVHQDAFTALHADFRILARGPFFSNEERVERWDNRFLEL
jgi:hypothetical protein